MKLDGKVAIITGGARGLGQAMAEEFANAGAKVIAADMGELSYSHPNVEGYKLNVTDSEACLKFFNDVVEKYGKIDILVNNAGITRDTLLMRMKESDWDDVINTNLKGIFLCTKAVSKIMMKQRAGKIVNMTSVVGLMGNAGQANYAAAKAGVIGFTKSMAKELAGRGINVNAVAPGFIATDMTATLSDQVKEDLSKAIPLSRLGEADDVAKAVMFLVSDYASYITGQTLNVDGGMVM